MPHPGPDPLAATTLLLVDGSNLLHALRRGGGQLRRGDDQLRSGGDQLRRGGGPLPPAALIGRLRAAIPAATAVELYLDGAPEPGMRRERIASGLTVRYAAPVSADAAILARVERLDPVAADGILVVTDDRELRQALERRGARTARSRWLLGRLERIPLAAPVAGNPRPGPRPTAARDAAQDAAGSSAGTDREAGANPSAGDPDEGPRWRPGRGATVKRGNPRRRRRARS